MEKDEIKWHAVFVLNPPICDGCGAKLKVLEVKRYDPKFLILSVLPHLPHSGFSKAFIIYDTEINKTIGNGTAKDIDSILHMLKDNENLRPMNFSMEK